MPAKRGQESVVSNEKPRTRLSAQLVVRTSEHQAERLQGLANMTGEPVGRIVRAAIERILEEPALIVRAGMVAEAVRR